MNDILRAESLETFVTLCKEAFLKNMMENMLLVLPDVENTEILCKTHHMTTMKTIDVRASRHPPPPPPWVSTCSRRTAQLLVSKGDICPLSPPIYKMLICLIA
jgi:hypothetical protein